MNKIAYTALLPTSTPGEYCYPCREYKGMMDCPECGTGLCVFCYDSCEGCGAEIDFSA